MRGSKRPSGVYETRAIHWSESSNAERLYVFNGLLPSPSLDALFDKGYVSFDEGGRILISGGWGAIEQKVHLSSEILEAAFH